MIVRSFTPTTAEERLVGRVLRGAPSAGVAELVSHEALFALLSRLRLVELVGPRIENVPRWFAERVARALADRTRMAAVQELVLMRVLSVLEQHGIPAAPVKGVTLAAAAHGDRASRPSEDLDVLLRRTDLERAAAAVAEMGWEGPDDALDASGTPLLHLGLRGPGELPDVELHWRVHWWETEFAPAALARATPVAPGLRLTAADHLAVVMLAYARDGLMGLRHPADVDALVRRSPEPIRLDERLLDGPLGPSLVAAAIAAELTVGTCAAELVGRPVRVSRRTRAALALADPFQRGSDRQISADLSLVDLVLAPPGGWRTAARRQLMPPSTELQRRRPEIRGRGATGLAAARVEHGVRLLRRYSFAGGRVVSAIARPGGRAIALDAERSSSRT